MSQLPKDPERFFARFCSDFESFSSPGLLHSVRHFLRERQMTSKDSSRLTVEDSAETLVPVPPHAVEIRSCANQNREKVRTRKRWRMFASVASACWYQRLQSEKSTLKIYRAWNAQLCSGSWNDLSIDSSESSEPSNADTGFGFAIPQAQPSAIGTAGSTATQPAGVFPGNKLLPPGSGVFPFVAPRERNHNPSAGDPPAISMQSIAAMPAYSDRSQEELRWEDLQLGQLATRGQLRST
jgi:hypothetical protein